MSSDKHIQNVECHLAEKVMKWHSAKGLKEGDFWCECSNQRHHDMTVWVSEWHPCQLPAHAAMVRDKMRELGWHYHISSVGDHVMAAFYKADQSSEPKHMTCYTESEASSKAAFLATSREAIAKAKSYDSSEALTLREENARLREALSGLVLEYEQYATAEHGNTRPAPTLIILARKALNQHAGRASFTTR